MRYKLFVSLLVSILLHAILILNLNFSISNHYKAGVKSESSTNNLNTSVLKVGFLVLVQPKQLYEKSKSEQRKTEENAHVEPEQFVNSQKIQVESQDSELGIVSDNFVANNPEAGDDINNVKYFKSNEVDIDAIPLHGIESNVSSNTNKLLEVYKLRIYINRYGGVDRVINLNTDMTTRLFYSEVEMQVKSLTFIPAKKNGVEVDSFIDIFLEQ